jgi:hypothetical protein
MSANSGLPPEPIRQFAMRRLWARMVAIYGHKWASAYGDAAEDSIGKLTLSADTWQRGLLGITEAQIAVGLQACIASADPWPPTLPEFRALCFDIPSLLSVKTQLAARNTRRSAFATCVWGHLDSYSYHMAPADKADRMLREAYEEAREHVMRGGTLPEIKQELGAPEIKERAPASADVVDMHMAKIRKQLSSSARNAA